jgi:PAS domain S-box-containing protein
MISVLYVEDETSLLEIGKFFLEKDGSMVVDTCSSVNDALTKTSAKHYDIIISDYAMPEMNGIDFLKSLRSRGDTTPFIIFTGRGRESVVIEALNLGADFYLVKSGNAKVQYAELMHEIKHVIEKKSIGTKLEQSDSVLRATLESVAEGVLVVDCDGKITIFNQNFLFLLNIPKELVNIGMDSKIPLQYIENQLEDSDDFSKKIEDITINPIITCQGSVRVKEGHALSWFSRVQKTGDSIIGRMWAFRDISDQNKTELQLITVKEQLSTLKEELQQQHQELKKKEEIIQKSEELMDFFTQATLDGIVACIDGKIVEANERFAEMLGYHTSELAGRSILDFISPDSYDEVMNYIRSGSERRHEYLALRKNGSSFLAEAIGHRVSYRGYTILLLIIHAVSNNKAALQPEKNLESDVTQFETEKKEGNNSREPFSESRPDGGIRPENVSGLAAPAGITAKAQSTISLIWEIDDAQKPADVREFQNSVEPDTISLTWEIDDLIEPVKNKSSLTGISEYYNPPHGKKRCPSCGSVPFEPDGNWCDQCGASMSDYNWGSGSSQRQNIANFPKISAGDWNIPDTKERFFPHRKFSRNFLIKIGIGFFILILLLALSIRALFPDFPYF